MFLHGLPTFDSTSVSNGERGGRGRVLTSEWMLGRRTRRVDAIIVGWR